MEDQCQRELAEIQRQYNAMDATLQAMAVEMKSATETLRNGHLIGRINVEYLAAHRRFTLSMQRRALDHAKKMAELRQAMEAARLKLVEAARQRKMIEKLRERKQEDWSADQSRREAAGLDEVSQQIGLRALRENAMDDAQRNESESENLHSADSIVQERS